MVQKDDPVSAKGVNYQEERSLYFKIVPMFAVFIISCQNSKLNCFYDPFGFLQGLVLLQHFQIQGVDLLVSTLHIISFYKIDGSLSV